MKKAIYSLMFILTICLACSLRTKIVYASEEKVSSDGLWKYWLAYDYDSGTYVAKDVELIIDSEYDSESDAWVTNYLPSKLTVPKTIDNYVVVSLSCSAFSRIKSGLKEVYIEADISSIPDYCFNESSSIEKIQMPESVVYIGDWSFKNCSKLRDINLSSKIKEINAEAFKDCCSLEKLVLPDSLSNISVNVFEGCSKLSELTFSNNVKVIDNYAFKDCTQLSQVKLPETLQSIGEGAFVNCISLRQMEIPISVSCIENYAFSDCKNLKKVTIMRGGNIKLGKKLFARCANEFVLCGTSKSKVSSYAKQNGYNFNEIQGTIINGKSTMKMQGINKCYYEVKSTFEDDQIASVSYGNRIYASAYKNYIEIQGSGTFKEKKNYKSYVTVTMISGLKNRYEVDICVSKTKVKSINSIDSEIVLSLSDNEYYSYSKLHINCEPLGTGTDFTYKVKGKSVKVDKWGYVTALRKGTSTVIVKSKQGKTCSVKIKVID